MYSLNNERLYEPCCFENLSSFNLRHKLSLCTNGSFPLSHRFSAYLRHHCPPVLSISSTNCHYVKMAHFHYATYITDSLHILVTIAHQFVLITLLGKIPLQMEMVAAQKQLHIPCVNEGIYKIPEA